MNKEDLSFLSKISRMYYEENMSQERISKKVNISRSQVSKYLSKAREIGIVEILIHDQLNHTPEKDLEDKMTEVFKIKKVICAQTVDEQFLKQKLAQIANKYLLSLFKKDYVIAVTAGNTTYEVASSFPFTTTNDNLIFVPLSGGLARSQQDIQANVICELFAKHSGGDFLPLHAPVVVDSSVAKNILINQKFIKEVFQKAKGADIALLGIGSAPIYKELTELYLVERDDSFLPDRDYVIGDVSYNFFDEKGNWVDCAWNRQVISLEIEDIKNIPIRIGIAGGSEKIPAIFAAIKGEIINTLVTDTLTAQELLRRYG